MPPPTTPPPATHAAQLSLSTSPSNLPSSLSHLRSLRNQLSSSLHSSSPPFHVLSPSISSLSKALSATQSASSLRHSLSSLPPPQHHDYPTRISTILSRAAQLSANLSILSSAHNFLTLAQQAHPSNILHLATPSTSPTPPPISLRPSTPKSPIRSISPITPSPPTPNSSPHLPDAFLSRARILQKAKLAAEDPVLAKIPALDRVRADVVTQHAQLLTQLEDAFVYAVYIGHLAVADDHHDLNRDVPPVVAAGAKAMDAVHLHPDLVRAIDGMAGGGYAASVVVKRAHVCLSSVVKDALCSEGEHALDGDAFAGGTASASHGVSGKEGHIGVFGERRMGQAKCGEVFEKVRFQMIAILRRLAELADALEDEGEGGIRDALGEVWTAMESVLVHFLEALLGCSVSGDVEGETWEAHKGGLSLLPSTGRKVVSGLARETSKRVWELDQSPNSNDSFAALVESASNLVPSIYNLEVIYAPLQQFIVNSGRLLHSWHDKHVAKPMSDCKLTESELSDTVSLPTLLSRSVEVFVKAVRVDVKRAMESALGHRAGTLLQPPSVGQGHQRSSPDSSQAHSHVLPPLAQTQVLIDIIASCLCLCVAVPSVSRRVGEIINGEILKPFAERAIYALNLAESWTDSAKVLVEVRRTTEAPHVAESCEGIQRDRIEEGRKLSEVGGSATRKGGGRRVLRVMRGNPKLTTRCLENVYGGKDGVARRKHLRLLDESEWSAVVRLITNAKMVIGELGICLNKEGEGKKNGMGVGSMSSGWSQECWGKLRLGGTLQRMGVVEWGGGVIMEAMGRTKSAVRMLREEVVERGIVLLHVEVALGCFGEVVRALSGEMGKEGEMGSVENGKEGKNSGVEKRNGPCPTGMSKPSSIFKASTLQLSDIERSSEDTSRGMNEYDEFGDRIACASDSMTDPELDEYPFPNGVGLESGGGVEVKGEAENGDGMLVSRELVTEWDRRVIGWGKRFGQRLRERDCAVRGNLGLKEREFVFRDADGGIALGIRMCGGDGGVGVSGREMAIGARLFVDAMGIAAAETVGWPGVECDYSVAEGSSASAAECRTLLYAAGLL